MSDTQDIIAALRRSLDPGPVCPIPDWVVRAAADRLAELDRWKAEAMQVLAMWDECYERCGSPGYVGQFRSVALAEEFLRLKAQLNE